ncbi:hypothetical protein LOZ66_005783 [Ophidiomyces ophidiicola]|nr:hypothetical protein LOZ66_005783 [Ophidiomyces ophidiicola]
MAAICTLCPSPKTTTISEPSSVHAASRPDRHDNDGQPDDHGDQQQPAPRHESPPRPRQPITPPPLPPLGYQPVQPMILPPPGYLPPHQRETIVKMPPGQTPPLEPKFFIWRSNGTRVPLVPVDELQPGWALGGWSPGRWLNNENILRFMQPAWPAPIRWEGFYDIEQVDMFNYDGETVIVQDWRRYDQEADDDSDTQRARSLQRNPRYLRYLRYLKQASRSLHAHRSRSTTRHRKRSLSDPADLPPNAGKYSARILGDARCLMVLGLPPPAPPLVLPRPMLHLCPFAVPAESPLSPGWRQRQPLMLAPRHLLLRPKLPLDVLLARKIVLARANRP